jgi:hypothetical protein
MSAEFIYTGKVEGSLETSNNGKPVFKGTVGEVAVWVYGKAGETLDDLKGRYALVKGSIESRVANNGRVFPKLRVYSAAPADPRHQVNLFVINGEVEANKRIKDGLYEALVNVKGSDFKDGKRVEVRYNLPVSNSRTADSDIGRQVTITGRLAVRQGKFMDLLGEGVALAGAASPSLDTPATEDVLDDDLLV